MCAGHHLTKDVPHFGRGRDGLWMSPLRTRTCVLVLLRHRTSVVERALGPFDHEGRGNPTFYKLHESETTTIEMVATTFIVKQLHYTFILGLH